MSRLSRRVGGFHGLVVPSWSQGWFGLVSRGRRRAADKKSFTDGTFLRPAILEVPVTGQTNVGFFGCKAAGLAAWRHLGLTDKAHWELAEASDNPVGVAHPCHNGFRYSGVDELVASPHGVHAGPRRGTRSLGQSAKPNSVPDASSSTMPTVPTMPGGCRCWWVVSKQSRVTSL